MLIDISQRRSKYLIVAVICSVATYLTCQMYFRKHSTSLEVQSERVVTMTQVSHLIAPAQLAQGTQPAQVAQVTSIAKTVLHHGASDGPKIRVIDYRTVSPSDDIECVPMRTAAHNEKICINDVKKDMFISRALKLNGAWEPAIVNQLRRLLEKCPQCQFMDIGSNIGVYALTAASLGRRVVAVEPMRENLLRLTKSVVINHWEDRITLVTNALSDVYENVSFWRPPGNPGGSHSQSKSVVMDKTYTKTQDDVPTAKMDDLLQVISFDKAVMKIDIEGYEPRAFRFASMLFHKVEINHVFMEWGKKGALEKAYVEPMIYFFTSRGYAVHNTNLARLPGGHTFEEARRWPYDIVWIKK